MSPPSSARVQEQLTDTFRPPPSDGQPADSKVPLESGVPPARGAAPNLLARGEAHAAAALSACTRAEANLGALLRNVQHLAATISSAREAKADVVQELEYLRALLADADGEQLTLKHRVALLEQALERSEREGARERAFLLHEQDTFIAGLWDEHAYEVRELRRRLTTTEQTLRASQEESQTLATDADGARREAEELTRRLLRAEGEVSRLIDASSDMRDTLARLHAEREEARVAAAHASRERDQLQTEIARLKSVEPSSSSGAAAAPIPLVVRGESARVTAARLDRELEAPRSPSQMGSPVRRPSVPPEELRAAITEAALEHAVRPAPSSRSGLKQKPDPSTRPLIGYSLSGDLPEERIENPRPGSRPPR